MDGDRESELLHRISNLERKVSHLYEIASRDEPDFDSSAVSEEVRLLVGQNRTLEAIKLHREQTGIGLAEARDTISRLGHTS